MHLLHPIPEEDSTSLSQSGSSPARSHSLPLDPAAAENATSAAAAAAAAGGGSSSSSGSGSSSTDSSRRVTFSEGVQLPERGRNSWRGDNEPANGREARRDIGREIGREQLGEGERTVVGAEPLMDEPVVMRDAGSLITSTGALEEGMRRSVGDGSALDGPDYGFGICAVDFDGGLGGGIGGEVGFERGGGGVERMWEGRT
ncbi:hypothetical protein CLOM_g21868 [Closterium sp. NIES-68]|nr:hypothetical protein CLOM_g21868 [Closterium sp. NIES-68]GJP66484.1 hypothetical protein CLOP_g23411 [Closterium sp. NIES-67]